MVQRGRVRAQVGGWRRRTGVIYRPGTIFAESLPRRYWRPSNDGGDDAPLTPRGRWVFRATMLVVVAVGVALIMWVRP